MSQPSTTQLRDFLRDHFNLDELKDLCLELQVEYEDLEGSTLTAKAWELVQYMERRGRLVDLRAILAEQRKDAYRAVFGEEAARPAITDTPAPRRRRSQYVRNPQQIFISHATADAEFAHRLADDLRHAGFTVWIAPESIPDGQWVSAINRGLAESGVMVLVLTLAAAVSTWVEMETNVAIRLEREGKMRFIPLCLEPDDYDPLWHGYQWVMFDHGYTAGWRDLSIKLGAVPAVIQDNSPQPEKSPTPNRRIHEKTGIELIRIPAGPFLYGSSDADTMARDHEKPQRTIDLPEYRIGRYPVTNRDYKRFLDANPNHRVPFFDADWAKPYNWDGKSRSYPANKADHPVVLVSWGDAQAFCDWAGLILPTEEQWEKAARGTDGRLWPWGDQKPTDGHCNFNGNVGGTTPVGKYSPRGDSPRGCADMAGNVWEWTGSWFSQGSTRALRGGSWGSIDLGTRAAFRFSDIPDLRDINVGFRVAELLSDPEF